MRKRKRRRMRTKAKYPYGSLSWLAHESRTSARGVVSFRPLQLSRWGSNFQGTSEDCPESRLKGLLPNNRPSESPSNSFCIPYIPEETRRYAKVSSSPLPNLPKEARLRKVAPCHFRDKF